MSLLTKKAQEEFDTLVGKLREVGVKVLAVDDLYEQNTPDSIFPNNWISFHQNGDDGRSTLCLLKTAVGKGARIY